MTIITRDRLRGARSSLAVKAPCRVATTANITLSGVQTIDGVLVAAEDRVLVKDQTAGAENGVYIVKTGAWERSPDWSSSHDVTQGTRVRVVQGAAGQGDWEVTTTGPIEVGTTSVALSYYNIPTVNLTNLTTTGAISAGTSLAAGTSITAGTSIAATGGTLNVGVDDDTPGVVSVFGGGNGEDGGSVDLYNASDHDGDTEFYRLAPNANGDLKIGRGGNDDVVIERTAGSVLLAQVSGVVTVGADDSVPAQLILRGGGNTEAGASVKWHQAADDDATAAGEFWEAIVEGGTWVLQREDGTDALSVNADATLNFPQHTNGFIATGDSGAVSAILKTATDVTGSRAANTTYQNTTGRPIFVCIVAAHSVSRDIEISSDNFSSSTIAVGRVPSNNVSECCSFFVPDDWYYRINGTVTSLVTWIEY